VPEHRPKHSLRHAHEASIKIENWHDRFRWFARETSRVAGSPVSFLLAVLVIVVWGVSGPVFQFSDTWQLVINTGTTIVTFLMVFLIQNSQNRDALAVQIKLSELIIAVRGAENRIADAEEMSDEDLERLHEEYRNCANSALETLQRRHARAADLEAKHDVAAKAETAGKAGAEASSKATAEAASE
jgi:low affinity Fe/Cu permease